MQHGSAGGLHLQTKYASVWLVTSHLDPGANVSEYSNSLSDTSFVLARAPPNSETAMGIDAQTGVSHFQSMSYVGEHVHENESTHTWKSNFFYAQLCEWRLSLVNTLSVQDGGGWTHVPHHMRYGPKQIDYIAASAGLLPNSKEQRLTNLRSHCL